MWMNLEKSMQRRRTSIHRCIPIMTQRRALQTRILKTENYEKCWLHHCICKVEKTVNPLECQLHRRDLLHCYREEEQVQKRIQPDVGKGLMSSSSQEPSATEKPAATLSLGSEEPGNHFTLTRQIWEDLFLKAIKIICSVKQSLNLWGRNIKLDLSTIESVSYSNKVMLKDWNYKTFKMDILNLDENKFVHKKIIYEGKGSPRYSYPKHARNGRNEESWGNTSWRSLSSKNERNSWDNSTAHFSVAENARTDEFYEWSGRISTSGIKLQCDCFTFPVSLQWFQVLVPCWAATTLASWHMEYIGITGKLFFW